MRCAACHAENDDAALACRGCGVALVRACPACGESGPAGYRYCGRCGAALQAGATWQARPPRADERERRQLTILFCDLAGSTSLSAQLDAEDFDHVISAYFALCKSIFERHGGFVDKEEGDCLRVYFGFPFALDDDAPRAVRAALEVLDAVGDLGRRLGCPLSVHVGIHTGEVLAGGAADQARHVPLVVGEAPNIARRLEEAAGAGSLVVSATTHRLVEHHFVALPLGALALKGVPRRLEAFRITGRRDGATAIEQFDRRVLPPLRGRDDEMSLLGRKWMRAMQARGQIVLVGGEPGIGKSRLVHAFTASLAGGVGRVLTTQCQQHFSNSALYPLVDLLRRFLGLEGDRPGASATAALESAFAAGRLPQPEALPLAAGLLSMPAQAAHANRMLRERTLEWLAGWLAGDGHAGPCALVIEDLQWADASTLDCLAMLIQASPTRPVLVVLTHRPEFVPPWRLREHVESLTLQRLSSAETRAMVRALAGAAALTGDLARRIAERSDGVPLFAEELTKMLLESGDRQRLAGAGGAADGAAISIPETLRGSLVARLDHLSQAKSIAQLASVIGREFSYRLIRRVSNATDERLQAALDELVAAELLFQIGQGPHGSYVFKHALVQDAAYLSLLKGKRAEYHLRTADALAEHFADLIEQHPELAAHHYTAAGRAERAFDYWQRAGMRALAASADVEAVGHLRMARQQLAAMPDAADRASLEVQCLTTLGSALTAIRGYGAAEVEECFARAYDLCRDLDDPDPLYSALTGLHTFYLVRGDLRHAVEIGERLVAIADGRDDRLKRAQSHRCLGWTLFCKGRFAASREHLSIALGLFDRLRAHDHKRVHGAHPWVVGFVNMAWLEWITGHPERAMERSGDGVGLARELRQPLALAYALCMSAAVRCCMGDAEATLTLADEAIELAVRHDLPYWSSWGRTLCGWAMVRMGRRDQGVALMESSLQAYRDTGGLLLEPLSLALLAESHAHAGAVAQARRAVDGAFAVGTLDGEYFYAAEMHRLRGELALAAGGDRQAALADLRRAVEIARQQGAAALEERAAAALRRLAV